MDTDYQQYITGVILAGGRAVRMGGQDKGLVDLNDRKMIEYVIDALRPQVASLFINANRHQTEYAHLGQCPVIADNYGNYEGPLAGMLSGLHNAQTDYVLFVPCDSPLLTSSLAQRLYSALVQNQADISIASDNQRLQPVFVLIKRDLLTALRQFLANGERKVERWYASQAVITVDFSDVPDTFLNINTPEEKQTLLHRLQQ
ncbi:molybdenum cofactor guanylyltransferase MobA [Beggiatoa leptomitoformis]|uniref:Molybdenum cofactor guanylyltransferase n=1 Tax=Beggiatoa leptomitoformis TaxID=288004 RepID=A0A2N9YCQ6_9GAMM|nr:molybdenum cofactor guanylyltransferase MobA [Beggiatoa leptomitoformis]ALG66457.1 molybdenum cofactor guanylyltransferase [Beggiatoa leptomitoformis]AUI68261.1 molybdenum cofactor guanylyltransferase [Beggiatoa leptomitoformis]